MECCVAVMVCCQAGLWAAHWHVSTAMVVSGPPATNNSSLIAQHVLACSGLGGLSVGELIGDRPPVEPAPSCRLLVASRKSKHQHVMHVYGCRLECCTLLLRLQWLLVWRCTCACCLCTGRCLLFITFCQCPGAILC